LSEELPANTPKTADCAWDPENVYDAEYNWYAPTADWVDMAAVAVDIDGTTIGVARGFLTTTFRLGKDAPLRTAATTVSFP
jgi:hypothetical protein